MKVTVPDSWNEVTIGQYQEMSDLSKNENQSLEILSILLDKDPEQVRLYDPQSISKIMNALSWITGQPDETKYRQSIEVDGKEYRLIENLNQFSGGEWWDMEVHLKNLNSNLHNLFAMLYRPIGEVYDSETCKQRAELFQDKAMIGDVYGSLVFFSIVETKSIKHIQDYLITQGLRKISEMSQKKTKKNGWMKRLKTKVKSGIGITTSMS